MINNYIYPIYTSNYDNHLVLAEDYYIEGITIPKGFTSDGLTLKVRLLRLVINKYQPSLAPFYFLHDYLCKEDRYDEAIDIGTKVLLNINNSTRYRLGMWAVNKYCNYSRNKSIKDK